MTNYLKRKTPAKPRLVMAVTNDLETDNRVHKVATTLTNMGFSVTLVGRLTHKSKALASRNYRTIRFRLLFSKGPLFYASYNIHLFFFLIFKRFGVIVSNDLDTLAACFAASKLCRTDLVYDSHELFTEVPELVCRPRVQKFWLNIEKAILPKVKYAYTVCQSIADFYRDKYGVEFDVVRNIPNKGDASQKTETPPFPTNKPVILYQGAVNVHRGIEEAILSMHQVKNATLVIIGDGDIAANCRQLVENENLNDKVVFAGRIPFEQLSSITPYASIGLSVEKDMGLNYRFALPNKLFDYIQAGVPVIASALPEMKRIVNAYEIGETIEHTTPLAISTAINKLLANPAQLSSYKLNCERAANELCWENEEHVLWGIYSKFLP